jgi:hypothetical protein
MIISRIRKKVKNEVKLIIFENEYGGSRNASITGSLMTKYFSEFLKWNLPDIYAELIQ